MNHYAKSSWPLVIWSGSLLKFIQWELHPFKVKLSDTVSQIMTVKKLHTAVPVDHSSFNIRYLLFVQDVMSSDLIAFPFIVTIYKKNLSSK